MEDRHVAGATPELLADRGIEALDQRRHVGHIHAEAGCRAVTTEATQQRGTRAQCREHVDLSVGAHRTSSLTARPVEKTAPGPGGDTEPTMPAAAMPTIPCNHRSWPMTMP